MASFDPAQANCKAALADSKLNEDRISHVRFAPSDDNSLEPRLNPVDSYSLVFTPQNQRSFSQTDGKRRTVDSCPGAIIRLAKPRETRNSRIGIETDGVRLEYLVRAFLTDGGAA